MINDFSNLFLKDAMDNLASCIDYAVNFQGIEINEFVSYFLNSNYDSYFYNMYPKYVSGISGSDVAERILENQNVEFSSKEYITSSSRSKEYWAGWVVMYFVNAKKMTFKELFEYVSLSEIVSMYNPYHEASEDKFVEALTEVISRRRKTTRLQKARIEVGLTQAQLSEKSGVNIRTLQQYEIGSKDLSKASYSTVISLANALYTDASNLIDSVL